MTATMAQSKSTIRKANLREYLEIKALKVLKLCSFVKMSIFRILAETMRRKCEKRGFQACHTDLPDALLSQHMNRDVLRELSSFIVVDGDGANLLLLTLTVELMIAILKLL